MTYYSELLWIKNYYLKSCGIYNKNIMYQIWKEWIIEELLNLREKTHNNNNLIIHPHYINVETLRIKLLTQSTDHHRVNVFCNIFIIQIKDHLEPLICDNIQLMVEYIDKTICTKCIEHLRNIYIGDESAFDIHVQQLIFQYKYINMYNVDFVIPTSIYSTLNIHLKINNYIYTTPFETQSPYYSFFSHDIYFGAENNINIKSGTHLITPPPIYSLHMNTISKIISQLCIAYTEEKSLTFIYFTPSDIDVSQLRSCYFLKKEIQLTKHEHYYYSNSKQKYVKNTDDLNIFILSTNNVSNMPLICNILYSNFTEPLKNDKNEKNVYEIFFNN